MITGSVAGPGASTDVSASVGRVVLVARLQMVAEALGVALTQRNANASTLTWSEARRRCPEALEPDGVAVVLNDLASREDLEATQALVARTSGRGVVLTSRPPGRFWGALLASGAAGLLHSACSLEELERVIGQVRRHEPVLDDRTRADLILESVEWLQEEEQLLGRLARLSPRERQVLALLSQGCRVAELSRELGVAEATVRSQVKSLRAKLGVESQCGAVAVVHRLAWKALAGAPHVPAPLAYVRTPGAE